MRTAIIRSVVLTAAVCVASLNATAAEKWNSLRSKNLLVVGNASEAQLRSAASDLEQFREAYLAVFTDTMKTATVPTVVVVFRNDEAYRPFKPLLEGTAAAGLTGYFQPAEEVNYISLVAGQPIPKAVLHQYAHALTRDLPTSIPLWFTEGIAEFYSMFAIMTKEKVYSLGQRIPQHVDLLKKNPFIPLDELFAMDRSSPLYNEAQRTSAFYAQSWALVNYLLVGLNSTRQAELGEFLRLMTQGKRAPEAFQTAFKTDYKSMLAELDYYVRERADWPPRGGELRAKNEIEKDMKTRALSEAESEFYAGDLLLHMSRLSEAETHLKQATTLDPKLATAQSAMGFLRYRQDNIPDAVSYLKRAAEIDPKNHLAHYYYAFVLDKSANSVIDDLEVKRTELGKAIDLVPQYVPAYELLAYLNITADIDYNGTLELLQKANSYAPGNMNIRFLIAQVLVKKKDLDQADKFLQMVMNSSAEPGLREGAQNLSTYISRQRFTEGRQREQDEEQARRDAEEAAKAAIPVPAPAVAAPAAAPPPPEVSATPVTSAPSVAAPAGPPGKNGELVLVNPAKPRPQGSKQQGLMTLVDCRDGITISVKTSNGIVKFHAVDPSRIEFVSYVPSVSSSISCGLVRGDGLPVIITYAPTPGGPAAGTLLMVEFVEK
jgi:tetratricopeptide (TPR) repeat protein